MHSKTFLYTVHTRVGITFLVEASSQAQAEYRAKHPAISRTIATMLDDALSAVDSVQPLRGPTHLTSGKLVFRDELF